MLTIRNAQSRALEDSLIRDFEDRTFAHLREYFPRHCLLLGEAQMRKVIQLGWQRAQHYDLTAECCVRSYIEFMCRLGSGFDTDPLLPWAARILNDKTTLGEVARGDRLYDQAWDYIEYISRDYRDDRGIPTTARFMADIRALRHGRDDALPESGYTDFTQMLVRQLKTGLPAKCEYVGGERVLSAIPRAVSMAAKYGIRSERGVILVSVLMFVLGNGFADDPLLPWASAVLNDQGLANEVDRVDRLYSEAVGVLQRWWDSAAGEAG